MAEPSSKLESILKKIDHRGYPAYKEVRGSYDFGEYILHIVHVQGDPFAAPSRLAITVRGKSAGFPRACFERKYRRIALEDHLLRGFGSSVRALSSHSGSGKSGMVACMHCGQEILERSACTFNPENGDVTVRFTVGFPARGRTIQSRPLVELIFREFPKLVKRTLFFRSLNPNRLEKVMALADDQSALREALVKNGLTAFIADGSVLARESGVSQRPMRGAVPMRAPEELAMTVTLPHRGRIRGLAVRKGITLICGGGYHGKSTFLKALEQCVYPHIAGDGRELVATDPTAVKLRAEDGRSVARCDISMFITDLPDGRDTSCFSTVDASGSTSQAAATIEALEAESRVLLIDEDTSATNFMVRDELMQRVIQRDREPITPFIERIRQLYDTFGISTIIVAGSSGAFFHVADTIIQMDRYVPYDITSAAKAAAAASLSPRLATGTLPSPDFHRIPERRTDLKFKGRTKLRTNGLDSFSINHEEVDLRGIEQLVDPGQVQALSIMTLRMLEEYFDGKTPFREAVQHYQEKVRVNGFSELSGHGIPGDLAMPRPQELYACLNRCRLMTLKDNGGK